MITEEVIKEIYKNYNKPVKDESELNLPYFIALLSKNHRIHVEDDEVIVDSVEEFSHFKRFLKRGLFAVLEFDNNIAFVFKTHIIFFSKKDSTISVHFRPAERRSLIDRIFGRDM